MGWQLPVLAVVGAFAIALLGQQGTVTGSVGTLSPVPKHEAARAQPLPGRGKAKGFL